MSILNSYLVTSRLLRPFDPREYNTPNCSKTERHGVRKRGIKFLFFRTVCYLSPKPPFCKGGFIRVSDSRLYRLLLALLKPAADLRPTTWFN